MSLEAALHLVDGDRQAAYGEPTVHLANVAKVWSGIFGFQVSPLQVALAMAGLKLVREGYKHDPDSLTDAFGYLAIAERIANSGHYDRPCTDPR